ncbi:FAD-dependent oxidoreductase [Amycolatopsis sp. NPDC059657]|uniref:FAD-dependent oxidoreductase n=1 Tax=Amycolatopsis sp. NPDC059657 TaxID=3346899 RepID=UPI00366C6D97
MPDFDVLICGAGAGGLTLAHFLGTQGRRVLVVDKQSRPRNVHKGELVQPRTVQILEAAGLLEPLADRGARTVRRLTCNTAQGDELINLDFGLLDAPHDYGLLHFYKDFREVVGSQLPSTVEYWQGTRVEELRRSDGRVRGARLLRGSSRIDIEAALTVACDGQVSRLRDDAGIAVNRRLYGHQLVAFELENAPELGQDMTMYLTPGGLRVLFQMPGGRARLYAQIPSQSFRGVGKAGLAAWTSDLVRAVPALEKVATPLHAAADGVQVLSAARFHTPTWQVPGLVLLGDTAHAVHPMVGQGMNAAIGDAWGLATQMSTVDALTPSAVDAVGARYEAERRPVLDYVSRLSHVLALLFTSTSRGAQLVRPRLLRANRDNDELRHRIVYNMAGFSSDTFTAWALRSALGLTRS